MTSRSCISLIIYLSAALILATDSTAGQDSLALRLTLEEAQTRAIEASRRLAEAEDREHAAQSAVAVQRSAARPLVSVLAGYTRTNHVDEFAVPGPLGTETLLYPDVPDNYRTRLDLQWPIYTGGRTQALIRAAGAEAAAVTADVAALRNDLRLEVATAFWALVTARSTVDVLEEGVARAQAHLRHARERFDAGLAPPNEVSSAEAQESQQRMLLIEATNRQALSSSELARLIGVADLTRPIEPDAVLDGSRGRDATAALPDLVAQALSARAERTALVRRVEVAEQQRTVARAGGRPVVAVTGGVDYARPNPRVFPRAERWDDSWDIGVSLTWSLWDGGRVRAELGQADRLASAARRRLEEFDERLALEVRQRQLEISSHQAAVAAADDAIRAAREARRIVNDRYLTGLATALEVLDADLTLLEVELDRTRALANVRLAEAQLARALGR
jgi:outer membrane protein